jgi:CelD/BcsL family acetyltransferase involved in cellulose biosynthesis
MAGASQAFRKHYARQLAQVSGMTHADGLLAAWGVALTIDEVTKDSELEELRDEWSALMDGGEGATPFQTPQWLLPWLRCFASQGLWTLAVRRRGRLVGLAPLFIFEDRATGQRQVTFIGNGVSDHMDVLSLPAEREAVAQAVFDHLGRRADLWDRCDFRDLPAGSAVLRARLAKRFSSLTEHDVPCPVVSLPRGGEAVNRALPRRMKQNLTRSARRANELGGLRYEVANGASRATFLAALCRLHSARWSERGEVGLLGTPELVEFHELATAELQERGLLRLHVMWLGNEIIAAQYILQQRQRAYCYITAFDPRFAALGPGALLTAHILEEAVLAGCCEFDFLRGQEPYKYTWGAVDRPQFRRLLWQ